MKKIVGVLSLIVFSLMLMSPAIANETVIDEAIAPETNTEAMKGQTEGTETLASNTTPLHSVWPFPRAGEPFPGDPDTKVKSPIDDVKIDLSLDEEDNKAHPLMLDPD